MVSVTMVAFGGLFVVVGLFVLGYGVSEFRLVYHVLGTEPVSVRELPTRTGPVEIEGTVTAAGDHDPVRSPFTGTECLAYEYEAEEYRSSRNRSRWKTLDEGGQRVPFLVEDDTDAVRVDPEGADLRLEEHATRVDAGEKPPDRIARYVASTDEVDSQDGSIDLVVAELDYGNDQRFVERRLDAGEEVYVYGTVGPGPGGGWGSGQVDATVEAGDGIPEFVISDASERGTAWRIGKRAVSMVVFGAIFAGIGGAAVVLGL